MLLRRSIFILFAVTAAVAQTRWTPDLMLTAFPRVGGVTLSSDGKLVAYTVSRAMMEGEKSEFLTQIWVASADGKQNRQYTFGDKSSSSPTFSPDGKTLAFTSSRGTDSKTQVWLIRLDGGEAQQVTTAKNGVGGFQWSPDGKRIAYLMTDPDTEKEEKDRKEKRDYRVVDQNWKYAHLYVTDVEKPASGERKAKRLTAGSFHVVSFDWSPDGRTIVFAHQVTPSADVWTTADISLVPSDSGAVTPLVRQPGSDSSPHFSPDGKSIAYATQGGAAGWAGPTYIDIIPATGGTSRRLTPTTGESPGIIDWSPDGKEIFYAETDHTIPRVYALPTVGGAPRTITTGTSNIGGATVSKDGSTLTYLLQDPETAPDVYVAPMKKLPGIKVSNVAADAPKLPLGKTELISWTSKDGKQIEGLLTYPVGYVAGSKVPLILNVHGGPAGVFTNAFTGGGSVYPLQAFAQEGYAFLRPNPRGSGGYGTAFRTANISDWGFGDYDDIMTGVDKVIAMGVAHPDSLIVCGWSYGGFMTSFVITKTDRFKAAAVGAGVTNLISMTGTCDIPSFIPYYFEGEMWDRMDVYEKHSAMYQVKNVKTPTLILHGEKDERVPLSQGTELYVALKRLGVPTEMAIYPRTPHGPSEPKFIRDCGERMIAWFNKYLRKK